MKTNSGRSVFAGIILVAIIWLISIPTIAESQVQREDGCEKRKGLVILVEFPDIVHSVNEAFVRERFQKLDSYVREMSYGKVGVDVDITQWERLPASINEYSISAAHLVFKDCSSRGRRHQLRVA